MPDPVRVLFVNAGASLGGAEVSLLLLLDGLDRTRYLPRVAAFAEGAFAREVRRRGLPCAVLPVSDAVARLTRLYRGYSPAEMLRAARASWETVRALGRIIGESGVGLVHTNGMKAHLLAGLAGRRAGVPVIWHLRDYLPEGRVRRAFLLGGQMLPALIVANSDFTGAQLRKGGGRTRVVTVHNAVDLDRFHPAVDGGAVRRDLGIPAGAPVAALIAHLTPWKGHEEFLRAARRVLDRLPEARFLVVGEEAYRTDGHAGYRQALERLAADLGVTLRVTFTGFRADIPQVMAVAQVIVVASVLPEPFGRTLIEAMAAGRPVVATRAGAIPEIVADGVTGLLVPPGDPAALAEGMARLLAQPGWAAALGARGRRVVEERFGAAAHIARMQALYDEVLGRGPALAISGAPGGAA